LTALGLLVAGLELLEDLVGDRVVGALEADEALGPRRRQTRLDVLAGAVERDVDLELRQLLLALALERAGDGQRDGAAEALGVLGVDPQSQLEVARLDVLAALERVGEQRVDVGARARLFGVAAAGGDHQRQSGDEDQQEQTQRTSHAAASLALGG
jgi:hypothetical protein